MIVNDEIKSKIDHIKNLLKDFSKITDNTIRTNESDTIDYYENPLNPNLLSYCFDNILGFDVKYRIFEKINYVIEFDYKGTYATATHRKLSYDVNIEKCYKEEIISIFSSIKPLLENLFMLIGEQSLINNEFSMKNEFPEYFRKIEFYQNKIEQLENRRRVVQEKCRGKYDIIKEGKCTTMRMKGADYLNSLECEIVYDIESYIDTFFSAFEHSLTLLFPFVKKMEGKSYYREYIKNTRWTWDCKIKDICEGIIPIEMINEIRRIKEVYRNHNAHGGFSREMSAYVQIPGFGRYPMYVGKEYLRGFIDEMSDSVSYGMYLQAKCIFISFWNLLDTKFTIPMMFIRSGLPIPINTELFLSRAQNEEEAKWLIGKMWFDIDNQSNMDW